MYFFVVVVFVGGGDFLDNSSSFAGHRPNQLSLAVLPFCTFFLRSKPYRGWSSPNHRGQWTTEQDGGN